MGVRNIVGVPARGRDFFDRERERAEIWRRLEANHLLLPSPRRVGKTSLMHRLAAEAGERGFACALYADVAGADGEAELVSKLVKAVATQPGAGSLIKRLRGGRFAQIFKNVRVLGTAGILVRLRQSADPSWKDLGRELFEGMRALEGRWLVLIDELGVFVQNLLRADPGGARARSFLQWLRDDIRQDAGSAGEDNLRFVIASSVGLAALADRHDIADTINDLQVFPLGAFSAEVAWSFLGELAAAQGIELVPEVRERILERVGWPLPYFLQIFFSALLDRLGESSEEPSPAMIDAVFEQLLSLQYRTYFDWWSQRLSEELGRVQAAWARDLLTACSRSPRGLSRATLAQGLAAAAGADVESNPAAGRLFDLLESDGYWVRAGRRYRFRSNLLREYWLRKYGE